MSRLCHTTCSIVIARKTDGHMLLHTFLLHHTSRQDKFANYKIGSRRTLDMDSIFDALVDYLEQSSVVH